MPADIERSLWEHRGKALAVMFSVHPEGTRFLNNVPLEILRVLRTSENSFAEELFPSELRTERIYRYNNSIYEQFTLTLHAPYFLENVGIDLDYRVYDGTYKMAAQARRVFSSEEISFLESVGRELTVC
jgi:hypothetical protein